MHVESVVFPFHWMSCFSFIIECRYAKYIIQLIWIAMLGQEEEEKKLAGLEGINWISSYICTSQLGHSVVMLMITYVRMMKDRTEAQRI